MKEYFQYSSALVILIIVFTTLALTGCVRLTDQDGTQLDLKFTKEDGATNFAVNDFNAPKQGVFKALVKGSIYETGEFMSVFGTCLDGDDNSVNGTYALFNAWYPNGTQFIFNDSMSNIYGSPGYFLHNSVMESVQGTYLTSMECRITGDNVTKAFAFGEWQNPYWVHRISLLNDSLSNISTEIANITVQIGNLSYEMGQGFNITWDKIDQINATLNQSFYDLNQSIYYVATVANASVDRNDSYLAQLIQNLTGIITYNTTGDSLDYEVISEDDMVFMRGWTIRIKAVDSRGKTIKYPDSLCYITTIQTPSTLMTATGSNWRFTETITVFDYSYVIACSYA